MPSALFRIGLALASVIAISSSTHADSRRVDVRLGTIVIGPSKPDGAKWDGIGRVGPDILKALAAAFATADPVSAAIGLLAGPICGHVERPDPFGTAELDSPEGRTPLSLPMIADTFTPSWDATWRGVTLARNTLIDISLTDRDLVQHDPIGRITITSEQLAAAYARHGEMLAIDVHGSNPGNAILFVSVSVVESSP